MVRAGGREDLKRAVAEGRGGNDVLGERRENKEGRWCRGGRRGLDAVWRDLVMDFWS